MEIRVEGGGGKRRVGLGYELWILGFDNDLFSPYVESGRNGERGCERRKKGEERDGRETLTREKHT